MAKKSVLLKAFKNLVFKYFHGNQYYLLACRYLLKTPPAVSVHSTYHPFQPHKLLFLQNTVAFTSLTLGLPSSSISPSSVCMGTGSVQSSAEMQNTA